MGTISAKSWFPVDRGCKLILFTEYISVKKGHCTVFYIFYSKGYDEILRI